MSERTEVVQVTKAISGLGTAITQVTNAANHVQITIPAGKGGILFAVSISNNFTLETVVHSGGAIQLTNSSADWVPFYIPTGTFAAVTEGGDALKPFVFNAWKKLPGNSVVSVDFIPYDNQSQYLEVVLHYILTESDPDVETFVDIVHPLKADAVTSTSRAQIVTSWAHNAADVVPIPGGKGGTCKAIILQPFGTPETVVVGGGLVEVEVDSHDITPSEFYTTMMSVVGASGNTAYNPMVIPHNHEVKANSNYTGFLTPRDNQSQTCTFGVVWERPWQLKR